MNNKKLYKDTFDEITMSEEAFGKVRNMKIEGKKTKRKLCFRFATVLAALAVIFALGNGIAYAATGSTLVDKFVEVTYMDADGKIVNVDYVKLEPDIKDISCYKPIYLDDGMTLYYAYSADVKEIDGKVYLIIGDNLKKTDITDDFKDGKAEVEFEYEGKIYLYMVEGSVKDNDITIYEK